MKLLFFWFFFFFLHSPNFDAAEPCASFFCIVTATVHEMSPLVFVLPEPVQFHLWRFRLHGLPQAVSPLDKVRWFAEPLCRYLCVFLAGCLCVQQLSTLTEFPLPSLLNPPLYLVFADTTMELGLAFPQVLTLALSVFDDPITFNSAHTFLACILFSELAFLATCPRSNPRCIPGNR